MTSEKKQRSVVIISQYFYPDIATTGQLLLELGAGLVHRGQGVTVITAFPTYAAGIPASAYEEYHGIAIHRVWSTTFDKNATIGKVMNAATFFCSAFLSIIFRRIEGIYLIVSNPPFLPLIGALLHVFRRSTFIYLVHDVYPDIAVRLGYLKPDSLMVRLWSIVNRSILKRAARVIVLSDSMKRVVLSKAPQGNQEQVDRKTIVIHNWADGDFIRPVQNEGNPFITGLGLQGRFIVLYSGNMGLFHELEMVIEVAREVSAAPIQFLFIGDGGKRRLLESMTTKYGLSNVTFLPYQPRDVLPFSLTSGHVSLVTLEENIEGLAMPSKLYSILAAGNAVIAICDENSDVAAIIQKAGCGFTVRHHEKDEMVRCLQKLQQDPELRMRMGRNAREYFEMHFTTAKAVEQYAQLMEGLQSPL
jgi:glycosyltransferase involved in cell wall biosynthesis